MLRSLIKGVGMGAGMSIGQELTSTLIQHVMDKKQGSAGGDFGVGGGIDIQCGKCNEISTGDSRFCGACGNPLVRRCTLTSGARCNCGFVNAQGQKFCSECGTNLG